VPVHSAAADSSATDKKREYLRQWVREKMRASEMSGEPEVLEHGQTVPIETTGPWESSFDKNERSASAEGKEKGSVMQNSEASDGLLEGEDGPGDKDLEASGQANTRSAQVRAKRRPDKSATRSDKHLKLEKHPKNAKHEKRREAVATPAIMQDSFFGDESE
jgi:hypothetical protein